MQLSTALEGVLYQTLLTKSDGSGRVAAVEVMVATSAVRNLIREGRTYQLPNALQTGAQHGMQTLDQALERLVSRGFISPNDALSKAIDVDDLKTRLFRGEFSVG
ncbi:MAG: hypothetical protein ACOC6S_03665 [Chloroflexota bacterium]